MAADVEPSNRLSVLDGADGILLKIFLGIDCVNACSILIFQYLDNTHWHTSEVEPLAITIFISF